VGHLGTVKHTQELPGALKTGGLNLSEPLRCPTYKIEDGHAYTKNGTPQQPNRNRRHNLQDRNEPKPTQLEAGGTVALTQLEAGGIEEEIQSQIIVKFLPSRTLMLFRISVVVTYVRECGTKVRHSQNNNAGGRRRSTEAPTGPREVVLS
jgi:hypothetical protein